MSLAPSPSHNHHQLESTTKKNNNIISIYRRRHLTTSRHENGNRNNDDTNVINSLMGTDTEQHTNSNSNSNSNNCANGNSTFYCTATRQILNPNDHVDASTLEEGARMADYALSIYTWMLYVFVHPMTGFPRLMCQCRQCDTISIDCCKNCICQVCKILQNRSSCRNISISSSSSTSPSSVPLRRQQRRSVSNSTRLQGTNDNQQQTLFPPTPVISSTTPTQSPMSSRRIYDDDFINGNDENYDDNDAYQNECGDPCTVGDNICEWHKRALLLVAGIPEADLVYAQFNSRLSSVPYCILLDHERSLVVLSIRGSLSLEDIVTDTLVLPEPLDEIGDRYGFDGRGQHCHAGVLACFENVLQDLQHCGWLERLLERDYPTYNLRIVGHSLGAGVCALLGYTLRSKFPSLKVFGFSPPGCTVSWELATDCNSWMTSFVLDNDIVPRLSVPALEDLRDDILESIGMFPHIHTMIVVLLCILILFYLILFCIFKQIFLFNTSQAESRFLSTKYSKHF